ncbi:MAG: Eco57I restriction-modification methylase domain-containing protein [Promethearchaeota archaeon]
MGFGKKHKLEVFSRNLWESYLANPFMEPNSWFRFFSLFFNTPTLKQYTEYSNKATNDLILLSKLDNVVIFLNTSKLNFKSILRDTICSLNRLELSTYQNSHILVINTSNIGHSLFFFSPRSNESIEEVKIIRFPQGKIPTYFQELLDSDHQITPLELIHSLTDISALETDFLSQGLKSIQVSKTEQYKFFIVYLILLFLLSGLTDGDDFFDWLIKKSTNSTVSTFNDYIIKLQEFLTYQTLENDYLSKISLIFRETGLDILPIDRILLIDLIQKYPFSFNEPSSFVQEVSITPLVLSIIAENLLGSLSTKKKKGKYYTSLFNSEFIVYLAIFRLLSNKLTEISSDDLFNWVYKDWGFEMEPITASFGSLLSNSFSIKILDPACGSGTFLISVVRLLHNLTAIELSFENSFFPIVEIFGIDPDKIAVLVTQLRLLLFKINVQSNNSSLKFPERRIHPIQLDIENIIQGDFFFHKKMYKEKFDLIIGNPPWVRHEDIGSDYLFDYKKTLQARIEDLSSSNMFFDRKSDLYIYFSLMSLSLLENGGILAFLTSNAWLEVKYGQTLQKFLLDPDNKIDNFEIIHRSGKRLWNQLGINSIVLLAEKSLTGKSRSSNGIFTEVRVNLSKIPLSSLANGIIRRIEHEDQYYRTEVIPQNLLKQTHKWAGTFLRTSSSERKLIKKIRNKGIHLSSLADVRFGIKTGANDFFHLKLADEKQRPDGKVLVENRVGYKGQIELKYLVPLIKSPTHIKGFVIPSPNISSLWLFYCSDSPAQLQGSEAWEYIKWAETTPVMIKQGKRSGINIQGYSSVRSVEQREYWYSIGEYPRPSLLWTKSYHNKPGCFYNQARVMPDQRFYAINIEQNQYIPLIFTYLNSSFVWAQMEAQGNTNMGYGVLDTNVYWLKSLRVPTKALTESDRIMNLMERLMQETNRFSMLEDSQIRSDIDRFYAQFFDLSDNSIRRLYDFIFRSINNRLQKT